MLEELTHIESETPFDLVKIIIASLIGESRLYYKKLEFDKIVAIRCLKETKGHKEKVFVTTTYGATALNEAEVDYAQSLVLGREKFADPTDFSRMFYQYGYYGLKVLFGCMIGQYANDIKNPIDNKVRIAFNKLHDAYETNHHTFECLMGLRDFESDKYAESETKHMHLELGDLFDLLDKMHENVISNPHYIPEFGNVMLALHMCLELLLLGSLFQFSKMVGISPSNLFDSDTTEYNTEKFIKTFVGLVDKSIENRFFSLCYTFYRMCKFYEVHSGIKYDDKLVKPFIGIGEYIEKLPEDDLSNYIDMSVLNQEGLNGYKITFDAYLDTKISFIETPAIYISELLSYDCPDKSFVAYMIRPHLHYSDEESIKNPLLSAISQKPSEEKSIQTVRAFYEYFINNVLEKIPYHICPRMYYVLTLFAASFDKLKHIKNSEINKIGHLGAWQAEAYMTLLYKEWFLSDRVYNVDNEVGLCTDNYVAKKLKAQIYIFFTSYLWAQIKNKGDSIYHHSIPFNLFRSVEDLDMEMNIDNVKEMIENVNIPISLAYDDTSDVVGLFPIIGDRNMEMYDILLEKINNDEITFFAAFFAQKSEGLYNIKWVKRIIEHDYQQKTLDILSDFEKRESNEINMVTSNKFARMISGNVSEIISNNNTKERGLIYFNVFIKYLAVMWLCKDHFMHLDESFRKSHLGGGDKSIVEFDASYNALMPEISSTRTFNFLNRN